MNHSSSRAGQNSRSPSPSSRTSSLSKNTQGLKITQAKTNAPLPPKGPFLPPEEKSDPEKFSQEHTLQQSSSTPLSSKKASETLPEISSRILKLRKNLLDSASQQLKEKSLEAPKRKMILRELVRDFIKSLKIFFKLDSGSVHDLLQYYLEKKEINESKSAEEKIENEVAQAIQEEMASQLEKNELGNLMEVYGKLPTSLLFIQEELGAINGLYGNLTRNFLLRMSYLSQEITEDSWKKFTFNFIDETMGSNNKKEGTKNIATYLAKTLSLFNALDEEKKSEILKYFPHLGPTVKLVQNEDFWHYFIKAFCPLPTEAKTKFNLMRDKMNNSLPQYLNQYQPLPLGDSYFFIDNFMPTFLGNFLDKSQASLKGLKGIFNLNLSFSKELPEEFQEKLRNGSFHIDQNFSKSRETWSIIVKEPGLSKWLTEQGALLPTGPDQLANELQSSYSTQRIFLSDYLKDAKNAQSLFNENGQLLSNCADFTLYQYIKEAVATCGIQLLTPSKKFEPVIQNQASWQLCSHIVLQLQNEGVLQLTPDMQQYFQQPWGSGKTL